MKNIIFTILFALVSLSAMAQQDHQYTQFMFNKLYYNPAYAGSQDVTCVTAIVRNQWIGLDGAPQTQAVTFNAPMVGQRVGIGGNLYRTTIGISEQMSAEFAYSYRIRLGQGMLGIGALASVRLLRNNYNKVDSTQPINGDAAIPQGRQSKFLPNFGVGAYYTTEKFYFGFSVPRLLTNNIDLAEEELVISKEVSHIYAMGGFILPINEQLKLQPQVLLKLAPNSPFDADVNANLWILNKFMIGASYRLGGSTINSFGESIDVLIAARLTDQILFGAAYDVTLSELKNHNSGSIEVALRYCFGKGSGEQEYTNPRFF